MFVRILLIVFFAIIFEINSAFALSDRENEAKQNMLDLQDSIPQMPAKFDKPIGKAFPLLTASKSEMSRLDKTVGSAMIALSGGQLKRMSPEDTLTLFKAAFEKAGVSLDATCCKLFQDTSPEKYLYVTQSGMLDMCIPIIQLITKENIKTSLANGDFSKKSAIEYINMMIRAAKFHGQYD